MPVVNKVERLVTTSRFRCVIVRLAPFAAGGGERGKADCYVIESGIVASLSTLFTTGTRPAGSKVPKSHDFGYERTGKYCHSSLGISSFVISKTSRLPFVRTCAYQLLTSGTTRPVLLGDGGG